MKLPSQLSCKSRQTNTPSKMVKRLIIKLCIAIVFWSIALLTMGALIVPFIYHILFH